MTDLVRGCGFGMRWVRAVRESYVGVFKFERGERINKTNNKNDYLNKIMCNR